MNDNDDKPADDLDLDSRVVPLPRKDGVRRKCPICRKPTMHRYRPFCSQRCADVDLGRWVKGVYAVPTDEAPETQPAANDPPGSDFDEDY